MYSKYLKIDFYLDCKRPYSILLSRDLSKFFAMFK